MIALAAVAAMAAGHQVFPGRKAAARARLHMVQRELTGVEDDAAVLAGIAVAQQNVLAREGSGLVRDAAVFEQADH